MFQYILVGALSALGFAPYDMPIITLVSIAWFYTKLANKNATDTNCIAFGFGYNIAIIYWLYFPFTVEDNAFSLKAVIAVMIAATALGSSFYFLAKLFRRCEPTPLNFSLISTFMQYTISETFSEFIFGSGFPWNYPGYAVSSLTYISQIAALCSIYGVTFIFYYFSGALGECTTVTAHSHEYFRKLVCIITSLLIYGVFRIHFSPQPDLSKLSALLVQPNISYHEWWSSSYRNTNYHIEKAILLMRSMHNECHEHKKLIIYPESVVPMAEGFEFRLAFPNRAVMSRKLSSGISYDQYVITGAAVYTPRGVYNSLLLIDNAGNIVHKYDKNILVPFGEFTPIRWIPGIKKLFGDKETYYEYIRSSKREIIDVAGLPKILPLICYEIVFPILYKTKAEVIVNISNEFWFGKYAEQYQHIAISRIRAIEANLPVIRVANTGISAIIDNFGRIVKQTKPYERKVITI